jgi:hypothetical protein
VQPVVSREGFIYTQLVTAQEHVKELPVPIQNSLPNYAYVSETGSFLQILLLKQISHFLQASENLCLNNFSLLL